MKKTFLTAVLLLCSSNGVFAAQAALTQIPALGSSASIKDLRDATNTRFAAAQSNFTEIYTALNGSPWLAQTTAPNTHNVFWIDTSGTSPAIKYWDGDSWEVATSGVDGTYTLPTASTETKGGVKIGARLTMTGDVLSADVQTTDISGKQDTLVSGTNIKTVNGTSVLGSGNLVVDQDLSGYSLTSSVLSKSNTTAFTPTADYHPATKKYVDDSITASGGYTDEQAQDAVGGMFNGNTETGIAVTYDDETAKVSFVVGTLNQSTTGTAAGLTSQYIDWNASSGGNSILNKPIISGTNTGDNAVNSNYSSLVGLPAATAVGQIIQADADLVYRSTSSFAGLINDAGTATDDLWSAAKNITMLSGKQATLVSGTNIKTVNGTSLLGSEDIVISGTFGFDTYPTYEDSPHDSGIAVNGTTLAVYSTTASKWLTVGLTDTLSASPVTYGLIVDFVDVTGADKITLMGTDYSTDTTITGLSDATSFTVVPDTGRTGDCIGTGISGTPPSKSADMSADRSMTCTFSAAGAYTDALTTNGALSASWTVTTNETTPYITSNHATNSGSGRSSAYYSGGSFSGSTQSSKAACNGNSNPSGVAVRMQGAATYYYAYLDGYDHVKIKSVVDGIESELTSGAASYTVATGTQTVELYAVGTSPTTLYAYVGGALVGSGTDTTASLQVTTGYPGIYFYQGGGYCTNWSGASSSQH